jgi:tetratricopeptide (TPR) repeat protein
MDKNSILLAIVTLLVGFIGGFFLANSINRSEINSMRTQTSTISNTSTAANSAEPKLSAEEIRAKVEEAERNPTNFQFQKDLGIGLYRYGASEQDVGILTEAARLLARANSLDGKDVDVLTHLGHAYFDIGFARKDMASFEKARELYVKIIALKPEDADIRTDLGISYYVQPEPDYAKAAAELQKVIDANPRHDRSMQFLAQVYIEQGKLEEAEKLVAKIKGINPSSKSVQDLTAQIERAKAAGR